MKRRRPQFKSSPRSDEVQPLMTPALDTATRWFLFVLVLAVFVAIRVRLLDVPLERDEGEYAYAGQLILEGVPPYKLVYNMKLPGTYAAYALVMAIFGQTPWGIHVGLLFLNLATTALVYLLGRRLFDPWTGALAAMAYAFSSVSWGVVGVSAHATHFVVFFALAGIVLLHRFLERPCWPQLIASGLMFGLSFLMKQPGVFFGLFGGLWLLVSELRRRPAQWKESAARVAVFSISAALPFVLTCLYFWQAGLFSKFWFWTFTYAKAYAGVVPAHLIWTVFKSGLQTMIAPIWLFWCLAPLGIAALFFSRRCRARAWWLLAFLVFSFLAVCPGFYFRQHYFVLVLPALSLGIALICEPLRDRLQARLPRAAQYLSLAVLLIVMGRGVYLQRDFLFKASPIEAARMLYSDNPFIESIEVANYIREHSAPDAKIAVLGSEPEIFVYAKRRSATGYIYTYGLMEDQPFARQMQQEMISEIEAAKPEYLVFVGFPFSWSYRQGSDETIFRWYDQYRLNYETVGMIDYFSIEQQRSRFGPEAANGTPEAKFYVQLLKRKPEAANQSAPASASPVAE